MQNSICNNFSVTHINKKCTGRATIIITFIYVYIHTYRGQFVFFVLLQVLYIYLFIEISYFPQHKCHKSLFQTVLQQHCNSIAIRLQTLLQCDIKFLYKYQNSPIFYIIIIYEKLCILIVTYNIG